MQTTIYTVVFRYEPPTISPEYYDFIRFDFASLDAVTRHLPEIVYTRLSDVCDSLEEAKLTVEELCDYLAERKNILKDLTIGPHRTAVTALTVLYS